MMILWFNKSDHLVIYLHYLEYQMRPDAHDIKAKRRDVRNDQDQDHLRLALLKKG